MTADHTLTLTHGLHAPAHARAWVTARTPQLACDLVDDALLITSELVTNAVRYGAPEIVLGLSLDETCVRIEVSDGGDTLPAPPALSADAAPNRHGGRGLMIVAATASDWGVTRAEGRSGKTVWAELRP